MICCNLSLLSKNETHHVVSTFFINLTFTPSCNIIQEVTWLLQQQHPCLPSARGPPGLRQSRRSCSRRPVRAGRMSQTRVCLQTRCQPVFGLPGPTFHGCDAKARLLSERRWLAGRALGAPALCCAAAITRSDALTQSSCHPCTGAHRLCCCFLFILPVCGPRRLC